MALNVEVISDGGVGREEALCRSWRFEAELLPLSASGRLMRDLRPVVRTPSGDVAIGQAAVYNHFNVQRHLFSRRTLRDLRSQGLARWREVTAA